MVTVVTDAQNRVAPDALPRQRLEAADSRAGEMIGRAVAGFGQDVRQVAEEQDRVSAMYDDAAVKTKLASALDAVAPIRTAVTAARGLEAAGAKVKARADFDALRKEYTTSLANPRQQRMFADAFQRVQSQEFQTYDAHEVKQIEAATVEGSKARQATSLARAVDLANVNDEAADASLADALVENRVLFRGAAPETLARVNAETVSAYRGQVAQTIAVGAADQPADALAAKEYLDKHAGEILPSDESKMRRAIQPDVDDAVGESAYGEVLALSQGAEPPVDAARADEEGHEIARVNADPLRGKGRGVTSTFTSARDGGRRQHNAEDIAAPAGTPVYAPMSGKVEKVWFDKEGGNSIIVRHPDGRVTGYAHLRNVNVEAGQTIDGSTVLGGVGNTGAASRGNHLHFTVRNAQGNKVDPSKQSWREQGISAPTTDRADVGSLYDQALIVAKRRNLSPKQTRELLSRVDSDVARNDRLRARAEDDARDSAYSVIDRLGDGFTSLSQIPTAVKQRLAPGVLSTLRNVAEGNANPPADENAKSGGETYWGLLEMSGNPNAQAAFLNADLYKVRGQMSKGEWNSLKRAQIEMKNGGGATSELATDFGRISTMVSRYAPQSAGIDDSGLKGTKQKEARMRQARVEARVRDLVAVAQQKKGSKLTDDEMAGIVRAQLAPVYLNNDRSTPLARAAVETAGGRYAVSVPVADRQQITAAWRRKYGSRPITERDIANAYLDAGGGLR